jgi:hypothetical protein
MLDAQQRLVSSGYYDSVFLRWPIPRNRPLPKLSATSSARIRVQPSPRP